MEACGERTQGERVNGTLSPIHSHFAPRSARGRTDNRERAAWRPNRSRSRGRNISANWHPSDDCPSQKRLETDGNKIPHLIEKARKRMSTKDEQEKAALRALI